MTELRKRLREINGRRRTRLLSLGDIVETADDLKSGGHEFLHGGHVANAYRYPAFATGAVVFKPAGHRKAFAIVKLVSASKGCSGFGHESSWVPPEDYEHEAIEITSEDRELVERRIYVT